MTPIRIWIFAGLISALVITWFALLQYAYNHPPSSQHAKDPLEAFALAPPDTFEDRFGQWDCRDGCRPKGDMP
jgi:hypothetical protein